MHTSRFEIGGAEYLVIHNGDWSGEAEIRLTERGPDGERVSRTVTVLPGLLLAACARETAIREAIAALEDLPYVPEGVGRPKPR